MARLLKEKEVLARLAIGRTKLHEDFIRTGRLRWVNVGPHAKRAIEEELDALIKTLAEESKPLPPPRKTDKSKKKRKAA